VLQVVGMVDYLISIAEAARRIERRGGPADAEGPGVS
jgi:hypothetical protein